MSDCRFGVSPVNYPDPDPEPLACLKILLIYFGYFQDYEQGRLSLESTSSESSVSRTSSLGSASRFILPDEPEGGETNTQTDEWSHL